jgi:hypothetical protein
MWPNAVHAKQSSLLEDAGFWMLELLGDRRSICQQRSSELVAGLLHDPTSAPPQ